MHPADERIHELMKEIVALRYEMAGPGLARHAELVTRLHRACCALDRLLEVRFPGATQNPAAPVVAITAGRGEPKRDREYAATLAERVCRLVDKRLPALKQTG